MTHCQEKIRPRDHSDVKELSEIDLNKNVVVGGVTFVFQGKIKCFRKACKVFRIPNIYPL